jgi:hypothetical protein
MILVRNSIKDNLQLCLSVSREMVLPQIAGNHHKLGFSGMSMDGQTRPSKVLCGRQFRLVSGIMKTESGPNQFVQWGWKSIWPHPWQLSNALQYYYQSRDHLAN